MVPFGKSRLRGLKWIVPCLLALMVAPAAATPTTDAYLQGYAAAVLERQLGVAARSIEVHDGVVTVSAEALPADQRAKIVTALSGIRGVVRVEVAGQHEPSRSPTGPAPASPAAPAATERQLRTGPLPAGLLFDPLLADPRWPNFSAGYQRYVRDRDFRDVLAVSFGETFPFYRADALFGGQWEVGLQAGVFAIFDIDGPSFDLINADYLVGVPVSYRRGPLSGIVRVFHQSSHLGDEFLLRTRAQRVNLSYESVDTKLSYELFDRVLRLYAGAGYLFDQEPAHLKPWSVQYGAEIQSPWAIFGGAARPIFAADLQNRAENGWSLDLSLRAGLQFESVQVLGRKLQWMFEYFNGHSPNGQFYRKTIDYFGVAAHLYY